MKTSDFRPFIIPIFLPNLGCPHRCVFCNQAVVTGAKQNIPSPEKLQFQINKFLDYKGKRRNRVQISFYGGNFLGLKKNYIKSLLYEATKFVNEGKVESIRFSTRPDTIDNEQLDALICIKEQRKVHPMFETLLKKVVKEKNIVRGNISNVNAVAIGDEEHYEYHYYKIIKKEVYINIDF